MSNPQTPTTVRTKAYAAVRDVAKRRKHHSPEPDSIALQLFAKAAVDAVYGDLLAVRDEELRERIPADTIRRLRQVSEILSGPDNHHGVFLSKVAAALDSIFEDAEDKADKAEGEGRR